MDEPKSLNTLFEKKLFRIPDYQRGYSWGEEQLKAFWEDLVNLPDRRSHYTGVLTLSENPKEIKRDDNEFWLIEDEYKLYYIVDGQQRLTTFTLFLQALIEVIRSLPENKNRKEDHQIFLTDRSSIARVKEKYLFETHPSSLFRTYKFGYMVDNPSDEYMRYRILGEEGVNPPESFYTLNLSIGKSYFGQKLEALYNEEGFSGLRVLYGALTQRFLFNEYIIKDEFDVFVAFETMNNRGKSLSALELLKNRLIYLTTIFADAEIELAAREALRKSINGSWKHVYFQLGRNKLKPLNDDDFLRAHWIMYFKYSRQTGRAYKDFLLEEQFTPQRVYREVVQRVETASTEEQTSEADMASDDENGMDEVENSGPSIPTNLQPKEIDNYVRSLKESSVHWFRTFNPRDFESDLTTEEIEWIERLNRLGMMYFRPLLMAILKNCQDHEVRVDLFKEIERLVFVVFRLTRLRSSYGSSEFSRAVSAVNSGELSLPDLKEKLRAFASGAFSYKEFQLRLEKKFENDQGQGYYDWLGLRYFLYEYELHLLSESRQKKVDWDDLLKASKNNDRISIEHIYPQTETKAWSAAFKGTGIHKKRKRKYSNSLGNLLLLSSSINSALQNDAFDDKKDPKRNSDGSKRRNGYADGSHSAIEVSQSDKWGPDEIRERGIRLLKFMEKRWDISFGDDESREKLLFLD